MLKQNQKSSNKAQTLMEYTMVLGVISVVIFAMSPMLKRGAQGMIKITADQIGIQKNSDQRAFLNASTSEAYLNSSYAVTQAQIDKQTLDFVGDTTYVFDDQTTFYSNSVSILGRSQ